MRSRFHVLVPIGSLSDEPLPRMEVTPEARAELALAFARDTIAAIEESVMIYDVVALAADAATASILTRYDITVQVAAPEASLGETVDSAARTAARRNLDRIAVVVADLPALETEEVDRALSEVSRVHPFAFVPDLRDGGTTMVAARRHTSIFDISQGSALRHLREGHPAVGRDLLGLRCDVDTMEALRLASTMRVGRHTLAAIERLSIPMTITA